MSEGRLASPLFIVSFVRMGKAVTSRAENEMTEWRRLPDEPFGGGGTIKPARVFRTGPEVGIVSGGRCILDEAKQFVINFWNFFCVNFLDAFLDTVFDSFEYF